MKMLAVPVPVFDRDMGVNSYCFRFQKGDSMLNTSFSFLDGAMDSPLLDIINDAGLDALTDGKPIFVPATHIFLLTDVENKCVEDHEKIIFVISEGTPADDVFIERLKVIKNRGFKLACDSKIDLVKQLPIIRLCDYYFIDVKNDFRKAYSYVKGCNPQIVAIVSDIETTTTFLTVKNAGFALFEGSFYRLPVTIGQNSVSPLKINYITLLNITRDEDFEIEKIAAVVQQDTALAISLLKLVNTLGINQKIKSINHAVVILGQLELRKWITMAVTKILAADRPNEITKLSLVRAKFAENIAPAFEMAIRAQELFLMGLFSALDLILEMPMEAALNNVQVSDTIRKALLQKKGVFAKVMQFVLYYETADWISVSRELIINKIDTETASNAYFNALTWYGELIRASEEVDLDNL